MAQEEIKTMEITRIPPQHRVVPFYSRPIEAFAESDL